MDTKIATSENIYYTLLIVNNKECNKCSCLATYILLGKDNEFVGFFCEQHGLITHKILEEKYRFENENRKPKYKKKYRSKVKWSLRRTSTKRNA